MSCGRWTSLEEVSNSNLGQQGKLIPGNILKIFRLNVETYYPTS